MVDFYIALIAVAFVSLSSAFRVAPIRGLMRGSHSITKFGGNPVRLGLSAEGSSVDDRVKAKEGLLDGENMSGDVPEQPLNNDNDDLTQDEALIQRVMDEVMSVNGVELDQLINPGKVVNLERSLVTLRAEMETCSDPSRISEINEEIEKKEKILFIEKRSVMRGWLKGLFVGQSVLAGFISLAMVYNVVPGQDLPLPLQVLGFWSWWLFIIPSLRARKPQYAEKEALNVAFLASPLVSITMPTFTKDVGLIWWANLATVALCYAWAFSSDEQKAARDEGTEEKSVLPKVVTQALNALDYGSGKERGVRK
jgi:hypothetical protein